jgi:phosphatidate cytidylyltransferase
LMTALVLVPLTLALVGVPPVQPLFSLFITLLAAVGLHEFYTMSRVKGLTPELGGGVLMGSLLVLSAHFGNPALTAMMLFFAVVVVAWLHILRKNHSLPGLSATVFGLIYVGWLASYFVMLHRIPVLGPGLVTLLILAVALADTGAYFVGRSLGRHKLAPSVSPNKTIEGAVGGVVCAALAMAVIFVLRNQLGWVAYPSWSLLRYVLTGVLLALLSQIGDLAESMMKRDAGIKDSGEIFPGHGGVLDRCDGFLFTAPMLYALIVV